MFLTPCRRIFIASNRIGSRYLGTYKTSTGLVGLQVDPNGKENLIKACDAVLESVKKIPETAYYRTHVEKWFHFIKKSAESHDDFKAIEDEINLGQIEEVIEMAKTELELVDYYYEKKGWEIVAEAKSKADELIKELGDSIYFTSPAENPANAP